MERSEIIAQLEDHMIFLMNKPPVCQVRDCFPCATMALLQSDADDVAALAFILDNPLFLIKNINHSTYRQHGLPESWTESALWSGDIRAAIKNAREGE